MRQPKSILALIGTLALVFALAAPAGAAAPALVSGKPFDVKVTSGVVDVTFTLTLSEADSFPVTITAQCCSTEEVLFEGTLAPGSYRFSAPLKKISGHGELKVMLKTPEVIPIRFDEHAAHIHPFGLAPLLDR